MQFVGEEVDDRAEAVGELVVEEVGGGGKADLDGEENSARIQTARRWSERRLEAKAAPEQWTKWSGNWMGKKDFACFSIRKV